MATNAANNARFVATTAGGTVIANAVSYAETAALAWALACAAAAAVVPIHDTYGAAAPAIAIADGPDHPLLKFAITD
ncbi:hypothetical protein MHEI_46700 [Mycobacterium heidelbergense]|nr:hypothetical protein MHEI_46700 [Mycobacterium heidelbergense]